MATGVRVASPTQEGWGKRGLEVTDFVVPDVEHFQIFAFVQAIQAANAIVGHPKLFQVLQWKD